MKLKIEFSFEGNSLAINYVTLSKQNDLIDYY